jgi:hypothetical protein
MLSTQFAKSPLLQLLTCDDIVPGSTPGYQTCKEIYSYHPLGAKLVEVPTKIAQSQEREITVPGAPENLLLPEFKRVWKSIGGTGPGGTGISADIIIANHVRISKIYGVGTLLVGDRKEKDPSTPLDLSKLAKADLYFNVLDPLNTAGSIVLDQDPNSPDFQKPMGVRVGNVDYHPSRCVVRMNEQPIYIQFTTSAFGYVGRSVYQRVLFPLKSFVQSMITDDAVIKKVALLIWNAVAPGSIINNRIMNFFGWKRAQLQSGMTGNVLTIGEKEQVNSINFQNLEGPFRLTRENVLKNIAMGAGMPSKLLEQETMVGGMAEGSEDAKAIAEYIKTERESMDPEYRFFDDIVRRVAWNEDFYRTVQKQLPEWESIPYATAFMAWSNAFTATWPNLLQEPDSEKLKGEEIRFKSAVALLETMVPVLDPKNKAHVVTWVADEVNSRRDLFSARLEIDEDALAAFGDEQAKQAQQMQQGGGDPATQGEDTKEPEPKPFGATT